MKQAHFRSSFPNHILPLRACCLIPAQPPEAGAYAGHVGHFETSCTSVRTDSILVCTKVDPQQLAVRTPKDRRLAVESGDSVVVTDSKHFHEATRSAQKGCGA